MEKVAEDTRGRELRASKGGIAGKNQDETPAKRHPGQVKAKSEADRDAYREEGAAPARQQGEEDRD